MISTHLISPDAHQDASPESPRDLAATRLRHALVARLLDVVRTERIAPQMVRITLSGAALQGFISSSFDDHIKVFLPREGQHAPVLPDVQKLAESKGKDLPPNERPLARDYTPRRYDPVRGELDIDFVIHGDGPGSRWAERAQAGDRLGIGGPRGSFVISSNFDWYLLAGDETAIPAMGRRIEELPSDKRAIIVVETAHATDLPVWPQRPNIQVFQALRGHAQAGSTDTLLETVRKVSLPIGIGHAWIAAESGVAGTLRSHLLEARGFAKHAIRASSYWRCGASEHHESIDD